AGGDGLAAEERREVRLEVGHGGERRAARLYRGAAGDRHRGGDGRPPVHGRALRALADMTRLRAEALHEASLPVGVARVERQRGRAGRARAGDGDELPGQELEVDVAEVVRTGAAQADRQHRDGEYASDRSAAQGAEADSGLSGSAERARRT